MIATPHSTSCPTKRGGSSGNLVQPSSERQTLIGKKREGTVWGKRPTPRKRSKEESQHYLVRAHDPKSSSTDARPEVAPHHNRTRSTHPSKCCKSVPPSCCRTYSRHTSRMKGTSWHIRSNKWTNQCDPSANADPQSCHKHTTCEAHHQRTVFEVHHRGHGCGHSIGVPPLLGNKMNE